MGSEGCINFGTLNAYGKLFPTRIQYLPISGAKLDMETQKNIVCGADIHKKFIMATILSRDGTKSSGRFGMTLDEIVRFKDWVISNNCEAVAIESTGIYWIPIYTVLEGSIEVILANAYKVKHTPGKKTDKRDSKWLAELCLNGMIEPSRIFPKDDRDIRALTRAREKLVNNSTQMKNRIHKEIMNRMQKLKEDLEIAMSMTGMGFTSASTILAEIGNIKDFETAEQRKISG